MTAATPFGTRLKDLRWAAGLTQEGLAERAGLSARAVSDLERDARRTPRLDTVNLLADALDLSADGRSDLLSLVRAPGTARSTTGSVPRALTPLIGREGVVAALGEVIARQETRLLSLTGPGGVGKTRLALHLADRVADCFADGVVIVDLAPIRAPELVLAAIAQQIDLDETSDVPVAGRLSAALRDRKLLILLDNFEHLLDARGDLLDLLTACPGVMALVTTRVPLDVRGERRYRIAPLQVPRQGGRRLGRSAAEALFMDRARAVGVEPPKSAAPLVAEICRRLDGLPLALELAAARTRLFPPEEMLARLEQRLPVLVGGPQDMPDRQRTMDNAIAWSYQLLSPSAQGLFRNLSVFAGGCPLPAAESISDDPGVLDVLTELVDASLVSVVAGAGAARIEMLETIREFGLERSRAAGEADAVAQWHTEYFLALVEDDPVAVGESERDNLRIALDRALATGDAVTALRLCGSLWRFWLDRGQVGEGLRSSRTALGLDTAPGAPAETRIAALTGAVRIAVAMSSLAEATTWCDQLVALARRHGTSADLVAALNARGLLARTQFRYVDAARDHEEAAALATTCDDLVGRAAALIGLSYSAFFTGDTRRAEELAEDGLAATRQCGDRRELAEAVVLMSWQASHAGRHEDAHRLAAEAVELFRELRDTGGIAASLRQLGTTAQVAGDYEGASGHLEQAQALFRERGEEHLADQLLAHLGHVAFCAGDLDRARDLDTRALESARRYDDEWAIAMATTLLGHVELAAGRLEVARALLVESAETFEHIDNPLYLAWCLEGMAAIAAADTRWDDAAQLCAAREALLTRISAQLAPLDPAGYRRLLKTIDGALGAGSVASARQAADQTPLAGLVATTRGTR